MTLAADLPTFFTDVRRVGRDPALLLLTMRALRQRSAGRISTDDLVWILGVGHRRIRRWLEQLSAVGVLVYDATNGTLDVELPEPLVPTWEDAQTPYLPLRHPLPTHWFIHLLPRIGRSAFVAYLYMLHRDGTSAPATLEIRALAEEARFRGVFSARWALWRLRRARLVLPDPAHAALVVTDPPPLTPAERRALRRRRKIGRWIPRWTWIALVALAVLVLLLVFVGRTAHMR